MQVIFETSNLMAIIFAFISLTIRIYFYSKKEKFSFIKMITLSYCKKYIRRIENVIFLLSIAFLPIYSSNNISFDKGLFYGFLYIILFHLCNTLLIFVKLKMK